MVATFSHISVIGQRYAGSLFDLAQQSNAVDEIGQKLEGLHQLIKHDADLKRFISSPVFTSAEQLKGISAIGDRLKLTGKGAAGLVGNLLKVVASQGRLSHLSEIIAHYQHLASQARGEVDVKVVSAVALDEAQKKELKTVLKNYAGKDIRLNTLVDPSILAGLVVQIGSHQIDTSLQNKLSSLKLALKEVD